MTSRLSVRPWRWEVVITWWKSSKIISRLVSLVCSLSADPDITDLFQGEHPKILIQIDPPPIDLSVADIRWQIAAEWSNSKIVQWSQWRAYRKPTSLFRIVRSMTLWPPPPKKWGPKCTPSDMSNFEWPPPFLRNGSSDPLHVSL